MDLNAAGLLRQTDGDGKLEAVESWRSSTLFSDTERVVLAYAEAMTRSDADVDDELFTALREEFEERELVLLTAWICLENFYSKFNRSFRVNAQGFCLVPRPEPATGAAKGDSAGATTSTT
jgi:alkylhydroperoxidase family enzyme